MLDTIHLDALHRGVALSKGVAPTWDSNSETMSTQFKSLGRVDQPVLQRVWLGGEEGCQYRFIGAGWTAKHEIASCTIYHCFVNGGRP